MAALTVQQINATGTTPAYVTPGASDTVAGADDRTFVHVKTVGTATSVTVSDPGRTPAGNTGTPAAVAIGTNSERMIPVSAANVDPATGVATVTCTPTTAVTIGAFRR